MKRKPKTSLTPIQQKRFIKIIIFLLCGAVMWILFVPEKGVMALRNQRARLEQLEQEKLSLEQKNREMQEKIELLQTDVHYLEEVARKEHDLLKKNEMVFDFAPASKKK